MQKLTFLVYFTCCSIFLPAQNWNTLYQQKDSCWEKDWQACSELLEKALVAAQEEFGKQDTCYEKTAFHLVSCYKELGRYDDALPLCRHALKVVTHVYGKEHPKYEERLFYMGSLFLDKGVLDSALVYLNQSLDFVEQYYGKEDSNYGKILNAIALANENNGNYQDALDNYQAALKNFEKSLGKDHYQYGNTLGNLSYLYEALGQYELALPIAHEALENIKKSRGIKHPHYGIRLSSLGELYQGMGRYEEALTFKKEALAHAEEILGKEHASYGIRLNNLGFLFVELGEYESALPLYQEALSNAAATLGKQHNQYGIRLNNLGNLYADMGQFEDALPLLNVALENVAQNFGKEHPDYGVQLNNLGYLYKEMGDYDTALQLLIEALENTENSLGADHFRVAKRQKNLGELYIKLGDYDKALPLLTHALNITANKYGKAYYNYGNILHQLGRLYRLTGDYEKALLLQQEAKQNTAVSLGSQHAQYGSRLANLALIYGAMDSTAATVATLEELSEVLAKQLSSQFDALSDRLQTSFLQTKKYQFDLISSYLLDHPEQDRLYKIGFNQQLLLKDFIQNQNIDFLQSLRTHPDPLVQEKSKEWEVIHKTLARQYQWPVSWRSNSFDSLQHRAEFLEVELTNHSQQFRDARKPVEWQAIQAVLQPGEAVIEFAHFHYYRNGEPTDSTFYIAYLLKPDSSTPEFFPLFEEKVFNQLLQPDDQQQLAEQLYAHRGVVPNKKKKGSYKTLAALLWQPLAPFVEEIKRVYYAPSGLLHRINLGAVPLNDSTLLSDRFQLIQLGSSKNLIKQPDTALAAASKKAYLMGGINYDEEEQVQKLNAQSTSRNNAEKKGLEQLTITTRGVGKSWQYLPATAEEILQLEQLLKAQGYEVEFKNGSMATEESLKSMPSSPQILHIATHGYFFPDPKEAAENSILDRTILPPVQLSEHPMVRSGLILAGANRSWGGKEASEEGEDGILTAYEISRMDLSNTTLVVLSACETGLGDIQGDEGVYGLQRAFKIAGAKHILMSLWQVPDQPTQELMTAFYESWLSGVEIRAALKVAQDKIRVKYKKPYYWAGFVLVE